MTLWMILGLVGLVLVPCCLLALALCVAARIGDDLAEHAHRDEHITSASLYPTSERDVKATIVDFMHLGLAPSDAAARAFDPELRR